MNQRTHESITKAVAERLMPEAKAGIIAAYSTFPDQADDIAIRSPKRSWTSLFGHNLCSLTHFQSPTEFRGKTPILWRGYNWPMDPDGWHPDLPNRNVECRRARWYACVGGVVNSRRNIAWLERHPFESVLRVEGLNTAADEMTFSTAASMAAWLDSCPYPNLHTIGASLHFLQDACVSHHIRGTIFGGHAEWESAMDASWERPSNAKAREAFLRLIAKHTERISPYYATIRCAAETYRAMDFTSFEMTTYLIDPHRAFIACKRAARYTAAVIRWWMGRLS